MVNIYTVRKVTNPKKEIDAIVLEFDDPIARKGIYHWAIEMMAQGYKDCGHQVLGKLKENDYKEAYKC